ncbi:MAG: hypothetical protein OES25_01230 [Acidobacteriota bacterium]|nr:hypothetical protein [Acidobacteriota bacterium]
MTHRIVASVFLSMALLGASVAGETDKNPPWGKWREIELTARGGAFLSGRVDIERTGTSKPSEIRMRTVARFFGARVADSESTTTLQRRTGLPQRSVRRSRKRAAIYQFDPRGYRVKKLKPERGSHRPLSEWTTYRNKRFEFPVDAEGHPLRAHNFPSMLIGLGRQPLHDVGDEVRVLVATGDGPRYFTVTVVEREILDRQFAVDTGRDQRSKKKEWSTSALRLNIVPEDETAEGLLNMQGETEVWVEAESRTLLHISGDVPKMGRRLRLGLSRMR